MVPNLSKSEKKSSVLALVPYYTDYYVMGGDSESAFKNTPTPITFIPLGPFHKNFLKVWASDLVGASINSFCRWASKVIFNDSPLNSARYNPTKCRIRQVIDIFHTTIKLDVLPVEI